MLEPEGSDDSKLSNVAFWTVPAAGAFLSQRVKSSAGELVGVLEKPSIIGLPHFFEFDLPTDSWPAPLNSSRLEPALAR